MSKITYSLLILTLVSFFPERARANPPPSADLHTIAEKSAFKITGRAEETEKLCQAFAQAYPREVKCGVYGITPEGRNLMYLVVTDGAHGTASALTEKITEKKKLSAPPAIWIQAGIHAGEIDGKDAMFLLIREILEKKITPNPLRGIALVFIPIVNLDGHERFGKWNRPNQIGPEEMGWRTTAQNLNLNRDFLKAEAPEMQALLRLWNHFDPVVSADLHVTDGAQFQPEVGIIIEPTSTQNALAAQGKTLETAMMASMQAKKHLALPFYPEFEKEDEPLSGFARGVSPPRFSDGYWYSRNRIGILVETHSWKTYANRVASQHDTVLSLLEIAQAENQAWLKRTQKAEQLTEAENLSEKSVALAYEHTNQSHLIDFAGYAFQQKKSEISGGPSIHYFPDQPQNWKVPFFDEVIPSLTVTAPQEGYFIPPAWAKLVQSKLDLHDVHYTILKAASARSAQVFRATKTDFAATPFEGRQQLKVTGSWSAEARAQLPGTLFVPIHQANARIAMQILEPLAPDSLLSWGFFNAAFEQKEYMEAYVAEDVAAEMLKNEKIADEFHARLKSDPEFAKDPKKRLAFFYEKHPSYDERFNLYPIYRR
jgi:murein tripeptide amidase MpaA